MKKLLTLGIISAGVAWLYRKFGASRPEDAVWQQATDEPDLR
jgi:hypothetical protein